jgi:hypothetical protein
MLADQLTLDVSLWEYFFPTESDTAVRLRLVLLSYGQYNVPRLIYCDQNLASGFGES